jgi:hypothetical protein
MGSASFPKPQPGLPQPQKNVALLAFLSGPVIALLALLIMLTYPVNRPYMTKARAAAHLHH